MFESTKTITLRDADGAGVLFFARYLALAHDVYEEFMASRGISFRQIIEDGHWILPVVHAESDYHKPLWMGDRVNIRLTVAEITKRSVSLEYEFVTPDGDIAARCKTVHVAVDKRAGRAMPLPDELVAALTQ